MRVYDKLARIIKSVLNTCVHLRLKNDKDMSSQPAEIQKDTQLQSIERTMGLA